MHSTISCGRGRGSGAPRCRPSRCRYLQKGGGGGDAKCEYDGECRSKRDFRRALHRRLDETGGQRSCNLKCRSVSSAATHMCTSRSFEKPTASANMMPTTSCLFPRTSSESSLSATEKPKTLEGLPLRFANSLIADEFEALERANKRMNEQTNREQQKNEQTKEMKNGP